MSAISVESLTKKYSSHARVNSISFQVPRGAVCGFVGPNGSGKTTTMRMLLGLVRPTSGHARVLGQSIEKPASYLSRVGAMIEGPAFYPRLSGRKNLQFLQRLSGLPVKGDAIANSLEHVGLSGRGDERYRGYSLGMKQRLGIAAALMSDPELLILDEPTNGLDPDGAREIRELIMELAARGLTIFISSHLLEELELMCDYFVMIKSGTIAFAGSYRTLVSSQVQTLVVETEYEIDLPALMRVAGDRGISATVVGSSLHLRHELHPMSVSGADFNRWASEAGITLSRLHIKVPSLAEIFFNTREESQ